MSDTEYAGTLTLTDGKIELPEAYAYANQFVVRQRSVTQDHRSGLGVHHAFWRDNTGEPQNPDLDEDEILLKIYGETPELYRVVSDDE